MTDETDSGLPRKYQSILGEGPPPKPKTPPSHDPFVEMAMYRGAQKIHPASLIPKPFRAAVLPEVPATGEARLAADAAKKAAEEAAEAALRVRREARKIKKDRISQQMAIRMWMH